LASDYTVRPAKLEDAFLVGGAMRNADVQELRASHGMKPVEALARAIKTSHRSRTVLTEKGPALAFGVYKLTAIGDHGSIWMLGTNQIEQNSFRFLRDGGKNLLSICEGYSIISNHCDARNKIALRWLEWLGFTIGEAEPYGIFKMPFHPFHMELG